MDILHRRRRVQRPNDPLQLTQHAVLFFGARADHGECADALAVQAEVLYISTIRVGWHGAGGTNLGKGLAENDLVALLDEVSRGESIADEVARCKALVCLDISQSLFLPFSPLFLFFSRPPL